MKKIIMVASLVFLSALTGGCSAPYSDMKSPCVGAEGSPCERHNVNQNWLGKQQSENG